MRRMFVLLPLFMLSYGCVPVLIGGAFYKGSKTKGQRQEFTTEFQKTNMERETRRLEPLDWCSETYKFDAGWADDDEECAKRIKAYKAGDTTALNMGKQKPLVVEGTKK